MYWNAVDFAVLAVLFGLTLTWDVLKYDYRLQINASVSD